MKKEYDVFVIGTGTAGYTLAQSCRQAGKSVGICDNRPMGGTCAMRGCQPKKYLVKASEIAGISGWMSDIGISPGAEIDWPDLLKSKNEFTDAVPNRVEQSFADAGIDALHGTARFISPELLMVDDTIISAANYVVATGSKPSRLNIPGEEFIKSSDDFLDLPSLPERIIFIGAGYISMEFAHIAMAAGAEVTVLEGMNRILGNFDEELAGELAKAAETSGIKIITDFPVCAVERHNSFYTVLGDENCTLSYAGDLIVHGAGRVPALDALDLDAGGIEYSPGGIKVNEYMQSDSNPRVYAIGDVVADSPQLSTVADMEAETAADNILHDSNLTEADYENIPSVVFTLPSLALVGMTEAEAEAAGIDYQLKKGSMTSWPSSRRIGQTTAMYKVLIDKGTERILGVHILGHNAGEIINVFALAMKFNLKARDLKKVLWAYPTSTSDLKYMVG